MRSCLFLVITFLLFSLGGQLWAQSTSTDTLNSVDAQGKKIGFWQVKAPVAGKPGYRDGQVIEEGRYTSNRRIGTWRRYWPNGKLMSEITYAMGRPRGPYRTFYPNGQVEEQGDWDLDRNTGVFKRWHPNGKPAQEFIFNNYGIRNGVQKYYHENGQLAVQVEVKDGKEEGVMKRYHPNGDVQETAEFNDGEMNEGSRVYKRPVHAQTSVGTDTAKPAPMVSQEETTNAVMFRENGYNTLYDRQLRISQSGTFRHGQLWNGKVYRYDADGGLIRIEVFRDGRYAGEGVITEDDQP